MDVKTRAGLEAEIDNEIFEPEIGESDHNRIRFPVAVPIDLYAVHGLAPVWLAYGVSGQAGSSRGRCSYGPETDFDSRLELGPRKRHLRVRTGLLQSTEKVCGIVPGSRKNNSIEQPL